MSTITHSRPDWAVLSQNSIAFNPTAYSKKEALAALAGFDYVNLDMF